MIKRAPAWQVVVALIGLAALAVGLWSALKDSWVQAVASVHERNAAMSCIPYELRDNPAVATAGRYGPVCVGGTPSEPLIRAGFVTETLLTSRGDKWPLSVREGFVGCSGGSEYWFQGTDGEKYGLNGFATAARGYRSLDPIWLDDLKQTGDLKRSGYRGRVLKVWPGDLIRAAETQCAQNDH